MTSEEHRAFMRAADRFDRAKDGYFGGTLSREKFDAAWAAYDAAFLVNRREPVDA